MDGQANRKPYADLAAIRIDTTIAVENDFEVLHDEWRELQNHGWTSVYQTVEWCETWYNTAGVAQNTQLCLVTGRDNTGKLVFLLPLGLYQTNGLRVIRWLSDPQLTYGLGVYDSNFLKGCQGDLQHCWADIVSALPSADAIYLDALPDGLNGSRHPLAALITHRSANNSYSFALDPEFDVVHKSSRSASSRRGERKRDKKLLAAGDVKFTLPAGPKAIHHVLDQMFADQENRLAEAGIHNIFGDQVRAFVHGLVELPTGKNQPQLLIHQLTHNGRIVAVKLGLAFAGTYWAMVSSLNAQSLERFSPGDYALRKTIQDCCVRKLAHFDLAAGASDYKIQWSDNEIPLHCILHGFSKSGQLWVLANSLKLATKRTIKNSEHLWAASRRVRTVLLGRNQ